MVRLLSALALLLALAAPPALACSVVDDYRVPTNLELTEKAQGIFLGRVTGERKGVAASASGDTLQVEVVAVLKGAVPEGRIELPGASLAADRFAALSNPYELESAHALAYSGGCNRYLFPLGTTALFFVEKRGAGSSGGWVPVSFPFARTAEDVPGVDAPWVRLVIFYIHVASLPELDRRPALEAERDRLRANPADPVARLMAADVARQLAGPNRPWNAIMKDYAGGK